MKTKFLSIISIVWLSSLVSCSDALDMAPDGRLGIEDFFKDNDKTAAFLNECYNYLPVKGLHYGTWTNFPTATSDESYAYAGEETLSSYYLNRLNAENHPFLYTSDSEQSAANLTNYWSKYFTQIRYCTQFIENIDKAVVDRESDRERWKAEAHVLRAYYLSELLKWYGAIPLNGMNLYAQDYDYAKAKRNSVWEVAEAIESDCRAAIAVSDANFPYRNSYVADQSKTSRGDELRINKAVAYALMAKMYLFAASELYNKDVDATTRTTRWKKAYEVNKEAVDAIENRGHYELYHTTTRTEYGQFGKAAAFYELNSSFLVPENDRETLWQNNSRPASSYTLNSLPMENVNYVAYWPSQELVDAFEVTKVDANGNIIGAAPLLDLANPYENATSGHLHPNYNPDAIALGYATNDPYACSRDPRMSATILKNGDVITWNSKSVTVETFKGGAHSITSGEISSKLNTETGYYARKFWRPGVSPNTPMLDPAWKYFRLAEIKLNYAEAAAEYAQSKGEDASLQNEAAAQLNAIRARVGMPEIPSAEVADGKQLILRVRNERRVELAFEECRFFDVRRWCTADGDLKATDGFISAMLIEKKGTAYTYERIHCKGKNDGPTRNGWQNKFLFLPVYKADVIRMQNATGTDWQNPGW